MYRQPLFAIYTAVQDQEATMEEKAYVEQMNEKYIVGVPPLFVNEKVVIDGDGDADAAGDDGTREADDTELDKLEG